MEGGDKEHQAMEEKVEEVDYRGDSCETEERYKMDEQQLLIFLEEEIWASVLDKLKNNPDAQTNCCNASPYFKELLKNDRVLFLFPKVVEIIAPQTIKRKFGMYLESANKKDYEEVEPYYLPEADRKELKSAILECRLACSAWNKAVEHCYESVPMSGLPSLLEDRNMDSISVMNRLGSPWTINLYHFSRFWDIKHFLKEYQWDHIFGICGTPKNPYFGRFVIIEITEEQDYDKLINQLLMLSGRHVWYCIIRWVVFSVSKTKELIKELVKWLGFMPNLKYLSLSGPRDIGNLSRKDFRVTPFPKLGKLEALDLNDISGLVVSEILRVNCHVKVLEMAEVSPGMDLKVGRLLSNLAVGTFKTKTDVKMLEEFGHHWKQLRRLDLEADSRWFGMLERNWGNTLTELDLNNPFGMEKATILKESREMKLKLPRIRRLTLWIKGLFYLDFIRPMEGNLEYLEIYGIEFKKSGTKKEVERVKKTQSIELVGFEGRMQESNIWKLFRKLETIYVNLGNESDHMLFSKEGKKYLCMFDEEEEVEEGDSESDEESD